MPGARATYRPEVPDDVESILDYLAEHDTAAAERFRLAVPLTIDDLLRFPGMGSPKDYGEPHLVGMRTWRIRGFPNYLIYYVRVTDGILIHAIMHGARDIGAILRGRA
jgi:toxin ParE1/3/4